MNEWTTFLGILSICLLWGLIWTYSEKKSIWKEYSNYRKNVDKFVKDELGFFEAGQTFRDVGLLDEYVAFGDGKVYCIDDSILRHKHKKKNN